MHIPLVGITFLGDFLLLVAFSLATFLSAGLARGSFVSEGANNTWLSCGTVNGSSLSLTATAFSCIVLWPALWCLEGTFCWAASVFGLGAMHSGDGVALRSKNFWWKYSEMKQNTLFKCVFNSNISNSGLNWKSLVVANYFLVVQNAVMNP